MGNIHICDSVMGSGKTQASISYMNSHQNEKFVFITPYLSETERIKEGCPNLKFKQPNNLEGSKYEDLLKLIQEDCNISSTHSLFSYFDEKAFNLIREHKYNLILDESFNTMNLMETTEYDLKMIEQTGYYDVLDSGKVVFKIKPWESELLREYIELSEKGLLYMYNGKLLYSEYPCDLFTVFDEVIILTYLFDSQDQKFYFDKHGIEYDYWGVKYENGKHFFTKEITIPHYTKNFKELIEILENDKVNKIGKSKSALSSTWYKKSGGKKNLMRKNLENVKQNIFKCSANNFMWSCYSQHRKYLSGNGMSNNFVSMNVRATNMYSKKHYLAYCVNVFYNPLMKNLYSSCGIEIDDEKYALSVLVQWIWRSAIRNGEKIYLYLPSKRMRELLNEWLDSFGG